MTTTKSTKATPAPERHPVETVVGVRYLKDGQRWWEGEGKGHTREFLDHEAEDEVATCSVCEDELPLTAFPTFTVPRKDGRTRGHVCRACVKERREAAQKAAKRKDAAKRAAATRAAKKAAAA